MKDVTLTKLQLRGDSMFPALKDEDLLDVEFFKTPQHLSQFAEGEVLLVRDRQEFQIHRTLRLGDEMRSKGDWALTEDDGTMAWGRVIKVNGRPHPLLQSAKMSQFSKKVHRDTRTWRRKWQRLSMVFYVAALKVLR